MSTLLHIEGWKNLVPHLQQNKINSQQVFSTTSCALFYRKTCSMCSRRCVVITGSDSYGHSEWKMFYHHGSDSQWLHSCG